MSKKIILGMGNYLRKKMIVPTRFVVTGIGGFLRYGPDTAKAIDDKLDVPGWKHFFGNAFYGFLDNIDRMKIGALNALDKAQEFEVYKNTGQHILGIASGMWIGALVRGISGQWKNEEGKIIKSGLKKGRLKDYVDGFSYFLLACYGVKGRKITEKIGFDMDVLKKTVEVSRDVSTSRLEEIVGNGILDFIVDKLSGPINPNAIYTTGAAYLGALSLYTLTKASRNVDYKK